MKDLPAIETLPQPPKGAVFSFQKVKTVVMPHPYCVTPRHVEYASKHYGGILSKDAIREAEKHGARCDTCYHQQTGILSVDEHEEQNTLFILVPQNKDLNAVAGLHAFLFENKQTFIDAGIDGFAFPTR